MPKIFVMPGCEGGQFFCDTDSEQCHNLKKDDPKVLQLKKGAADSLTESGNEYVLELSQSYIAGLKDGYSVLAEPVTHTVATPIKCILFNPDKSPNQQCISEMQASRAQLCGGAEELTATAEPAAAGTAGKPVDNNVQRLIDVAWKYVQKLKVDVGVPKYADKPVFEKVVKGACDKDLTQCVLNLQSTLLTKWKAIAEGSEAIMSDTVRSGLLQEIDPEYPLSSYGAFGTLFGVFPSAAAIQERISGLKVDLTPSASSKFPTEVQEMVDVAWIYLKDVKVEDKPKYANKAAFETVVQAAYGSDRLQCVLNLQGTLLGKWKAAIGEQFKDQPEVVAKYEWIDPEYPMSSYGAFGAVLGIYPSAEEIDKRVNSADGDVVAAKSYSPDDIAWLVENGYCSQEDVAKLPEKSVFIDTVLLPSYGFSSIGDLNVQLLENENALGVCMAVNYTDSLFTINKACQLLN